jgi:hypothetical protein
MKKLQFTFLRHLVVRAALVLIICIMLSQKVDGQSVVLLNDLSSFRNPGKSWQIVGGVAADLNKPNKLYTSGGTGILVNLSGKNNHGSDLFTNAEYGDIDLELDYMMAGGSNSGIYLQGCYELQLEDTWGAKTPTSGNNGGIYERWDDSRPEGRKGYEGYAPRQNASRAPGLWQHLKISFQAPRFDAGGKKIENAKILRVELNGAVIHNNVELLGPTRGAISQKEKATGPLRIQGDHGSVAFRNIKIRDYGNPRPEDEVTSRTNAVYPILVDASTNTVFRSFMDLPGAIRVVHAASVGSAEQVHYTYDMDKGMIVQVWRGGFLDATPMWHSRGDGSSRPVGAVQHFGKPVLTVAKLPSPQAAWMTDTTGSGYRPKGYVLDDHGRPVFRYLTHGVLVTDATKVLENGQGISREITVQNPSQDLYVRLAEGAAMEELSKGMYLVDNKSYYLRLNDAGGAKPVIRDANGRKELIIPMRGKLNYTILF